MQSTSISVCYLSSTHVAVPGLKCLIYAPCNNCVSKLITQLQSLDQCKALLGEGTFKVNVPVYSVDSFYMKGADAGCLGCGGV